LLEDKTKEEAASYNYMTILLDYIK